MKRALGSASILAAIAGGACAGGLDRTGQPIGALFEEGGANGAYVELSFAHTSPDITGTGDGISVATPIGPVDVLSSGFGYNGVGDDFWTFGAAVKMQLTEALSAAVIFDQPYGTDIAYNGSATATELGGTRAFAETNAVTGLLRYAFDPRWSVHGGIRIEAAEGSIGLEGVAYGPFNGYDVDLERDTSLGYSLGYAYEIPELALRVALTYNSKISHDMKTTENGLGAFGLPGDLKTTTEVETPQSINLDMQTGIAANTLLFGSVRWVDWSEFKIDPKYFIGTAREGLVDLDDATTYEIGLAREFTDVWAGSVAVLYEPGEDDVVSPLSPTNGFWAVALGTAYEIGDVTVSGGARYMWLGDAKPETGTPDVIRAEFENNTAFTLGMRIAYNF
ncbi:OmpP1/FadL family transporter [Tropicimonas isoalkanivorans]|uniref:Long-chain fatty acid transport protein n=1 Tax=Tropicimonas isoalkanivorans TaxID=441112 RepID=A0A1I1ECE0_9RHOB|nr:outer membrane protein transport protein [Tropicimonas isoalkanivorans]SFB84765.1 Long-chain fatty acid transport protein [Tropicimonas isoalkanivorans]